LRRRVAGDAGYRGKYGQARGNVACAVAAIVILPPAEHNAANLHNSQGQHMVRLADLSPPDRDNMLRKVPTLPHFAQRHWARGPALSRRRVAIVSTAGLHVRGDRPFGAGGMDYRVIPGNVTAGDLVMSHMSVNFDRSGFQEDWNVAFPLDRLNELARERVIGNVAAYHYSFMGAVSPVTSYEAKAAEMAQLLRQDQVDAVLLSPV
jgi:D-proline reductase (dithiol) PrdB